MRRIREEAKAVFVAVVICTLLKYSYGQSGFRRGNIPARVPEDGGTVGNTMVRPFSDPPTINDGINIGESFFLNRLRQGDTDAFRRLGQLHNTVDTPMSLLHNFFQVFNRPDLRQRNGFFSLLHNLAVARGLLPNSLAIGSDGMPTGNVPAIPNSDTDASSTQQRNSNSVGTSVESNLNINTHSVETRQFNSNAENVNVNIGVNGVLRPEITTVNISTNTGRRGDRFRPIIVNRRQNIATGSNDITNVTRTNNVRLRNTIGTNIASVPKVLVSQMQTNTGQLNAPRINNAQSTNTQTDPSGVTQNIARTIGQNNTVINTRNIASNEISNESISSKRTLEFPSFQTNGRFSPPSTRTERRRFSEDGEQQRGVQFLPRNVVSRIRNETVLNTLRELIMNRTRNQTKSAATTKAATKETAAATGEAVTKEAETTTVKTVAVIENQPFKQIFNIQRPSKLNFLIEMPSGVTLSNLNRFKGSGNFDFTNTDRIKNELKDAEASGTVQDSGIKVIDAIINTRMQNLDNISVNGEITNNANFPAETSFQVTGDTNSILPTPASTKYILQKVGHVQLEPPGHILQLVGDMNLTLSQSNFTIQRVGELNLGQRRQFVMEVTVNASSTEDKILLQRVGSTNIVPGERVQLHGSGDVRLLTKERVIIQRLGFVRFHTDSVKEGKENAGKSNETEEVRSVFRIEPLNSNVRKPGLLFLGNETNMILDGQSNETVLQFVGDILSEIPPDRLNITEEALINFNNTVTPFNDFTKVRNDQPLTTRDLSTSPLIRQNFSDIVAPFLSESRESKLKQTRISVRKPLRARIKLNSIGRIFSTAEMKFETYQNIN